jgi:hypothetical protein
MRTGTAAWGFGFGGAGAADDGALNGTAWAKAAAGMASALTALHHREILPLNFILPPVLRRAA